MLGVTPRTPSIDQDEHLPRGECRFILLHPEISGQRCSCQGFWLNKSVLGSSCECGHQACYHEPTQTGAEVSRDEYDVLLARVAQLESQRDKNRTAGGINELHRRIKALDKMLEKERTEREEDIRGFYRAIQGVYYNMGLSQSVTFGRLTEQDDKIEAVTDKNHGCCADVLGVTKRVTQLDELMMAFEDRLDDVEADVENQCPAPLRSPLDSRPTASVRKTSLQLETVTSVVTLNQPQAAWEVHACFLPSAFQMTPFPIHSTAYNRCRSRGLLQDLSVTGHSCRAFRAVIERAFAGILQGRPWMPLMVQEPHSEPPHGHRLLQPLPKAQTDPDLWDVAFLQRHCLLSAAAEHKGSIFIALVDDVLSWQDIRRQPVVDAALEGAWTHDRGLDGRDSAEDGSGSPPPTDKAPPKTEETNTTGHETSTTPDSSRSLKRTFSTSSESSSAHPVDPELKKRCTLGANLSEHANALDPSTLRQEVI
ncbi:MAG: hypothetical protein M1817_004849 [Caeruleum heppii]|nr:MAG: hypothetical protein M1817_004849 [Caeruleum heppii]